VQNELKTNLILSVKCADLTQKAAFLETSPNCLVRFSAKHPGRAGFLSSLGTTQPGKYKKSGNELKEYLKTKDIAFLNAANYARFACNLAQITR